jgi:membrane-bound lytic murein transglycosylase D
LTQSPYGAVRLFLHTGLVGLAALVSGCAGMAPAEPADAPVTQSKPAPAAPAPAPAPVAAPAAVRPSPPAPVASPPVVQAAPSAAPVVVAPTPAPGSQHRDLWDRMRAGFTMPELDSPLVQEKERFYAGKPEALQRMFSRGNRYLYYIVEEVEKRGMPTELALLPFVESAMNPVALSSAQAAGLWQFIPSTGKQYELSQNWWVDNRRDVVQSTRAALDYLQKIYEMHDRDWFLALASYNWGENAVARAVKNNRARGLPTDYLSLSMPAETRNYVPKLIALKNIVLRSREFGVALPDIPNRPYFATLEKTRPIDLKLAAQFAGMSVDEFVALNPAHNRPVIAATRNNQIKLPADRVDGFVAAMERHDRNSRPMASWQPYTLKPGESLDEVARRGSVSTAELLQANGLKSGQKILSGTQVIAPQTLVKDERQVESFEGPKVYEQVSVGAVYHRVQKRDTLPDVAREYGVPLAQLRAWNGGVKTAKVGSSLLVRPATTQTVLTTANGVKQVVARAEPPPPAVAVRAPEPEPAAAPARPVAGKAGAGAPLARAAPKPAPAQVARAPAPRSPTVKTVYQPPRPPAGKGPANTAPKRPRT